MFLDDDDFADLTSISYPQNTYADSKWVVMSKHNGSFMLTFVDFNINFGLSLTIGSGNTFERDTTLVKIGNSDISIERNDTILLMESEIWIWFQISDTQSRSEGQRGIRLGSGQTVNFDTYPSARGVHLRVTNADKGLLSDTGIILCTSIMNKLYRVS